MEAEPEIRPSETEPRVGQGEVLLSEGGLRLVVGPGGLHPYAPRRQSGTAGRHELFHRLFVIGPRDRARGGGRGALG